MHTVIVADVHSFARASRETAFALSQVLAGLAARARRGKRVSVHLLTVLAAAAETIADKAGEAETLTTPD